MNPNAVLIIGGGLGLLLLAAGLMLSLLGERSVVEERLGRYSEAARSAGAEAAEARPRLAQVIGDFLNRMGEGTNLFELDVTSVGPGGSQVPAG